MQFIDPGVIASMPPAGSNTPFIRQMDGKNAPELPNRAGTG